jgi:tetratricopeptide (TPR) repeat protein
MDLFSFVFLMPIMIAFVVQQWFALDMRSILKSAQRRNQLSIEGRWRDLEEHYERTSKSYRPFVRLHQRYLLPGTVAAQYALFLFNQGRLEEARAKVDQAIQQIEGKPKIFRFIHRSRTFNILCETLRARTLILTGLGQYCEARETAARLRQLNGSSWSANAALALLEYHCGHLDEALAQAQVVPTRDKQYDSMRVIKALAHFTKGEFDQAIQALLYEPGDISKFYSAEDFKTVIGNTEGANLVELQRTKLAGVFQPARLIVLAKVYIAREEFENANLALDQAEKALGAEPGVQTSYFRYRACCLAAQGKPAEAENFVERMRAVVQKLPKRSLLWETHYATGESYLYLGRARDALVELFAAEQFILHPLEKHVTAYMTARAHEAVGDRQKAIAYYETVATDKIPSAMRKKAVEALARHNG